MKSPLTLFFFSKSGYEDQVNRQTPFFICQLDAVSWLETLAPECIDLIVTDPPYESLEKHRAIGTTTRLKQSDASSNPWFQIFKNNRFPQLMHELYRVLKPNSHFYLFCDVETMFTVRPLAEQAGFRFWKPIIWDKVAIGMGYHYRSRYECILFFEKGKRRLNDLSVPDILRAKRIHRGYPTEKPVDLIKILIEQSTEPDQLVCDPFMGSGSTASAAICLKRSFAGSDIADEAIQRTSERLRDLDSLLIDDPHALGLLPKQLPLFDLTPNEQA